MENENKLQKQANAMAELSLPSFEELPDLGLYMDQVTGYLNRYLHAISPDGEEAPLTSSMINNYVKNGHITRPLQKKYSREQLAALYMLCSLKGNLSISDAAALVCFLSEGEGMGDAYNSFIAEQKAVMGEVADTVAGLSNDPGDEEITALAHRLAQRACAERLASEALIAYLNEKSEARLSRIREEEEEERAHKEAAERAQKAADRAEKAKKAAAQKLEKTAEKAKKTAEKTEKTTEKAKKASEAKKS